MEYFKEGRSPKHISDIKGMLAASRDVISIEKLDEFIAILGLEDVWNMVVSSSDHFE